MSEIETTTHRVVEIAWLPRQRSDWETFSRSRREAARLWNRMARIHAFCRRRRRPWPTKSQYRAWARRSRFPDIHSQSAQELIDEFMEAVESARALRKRGIASARFPRHRRVDRCGYRDVPYKNNQARFRGRFLVLPNTQSGNLSIRLPDGYSADGLNLTITRGDRLYLVGRMVECKLHYGVVRIVLRVDTCCSPVSEQVVGVDLGVNTLVAATNGEKAVLVSGRGVKSLVRYRNKKMAEICRLQSKKNRGSRRYRKLRRAKFRLLERCRRQVKAILHEASRRVADSFPGATVFIGKPFNDAARRIGRRQAQMVSQACNAVLIHQLGYKTSGASVVDEHYTSQTCPDCGNRSKHRRVYRCSCGFSAPRDVVGATMIRRRGLTGSLSGAGTVPRSIKYLRPAVRGRSSAGISRQPGLPIQADVRRVSQQPERLSLVGVGTDVLRDTTCAGRDGD